MRLTKKEQEAICEEIGYRVQDMMNRRGHTQKSIAKQMPKMSVGTMNSRMRSPKKFDIEEILAIANILNVSWLWLIGAKNKEE